jgi:hypothetical protein
LKPVVMKVTFIAKAWSRWWQGYTTMVGRASTVPVMNIGENILYSPKKKENKQWILMSCHK